MISVRLGDELEKRVEHAADARGISVSALIREAVEKVVDQKRPTLADRLKGIAGSVQGDGTSAADTKRHFAKLLVEAHERKTRAYAARKARQRKSKR